MKQRRYRKQPVIVMPDKSPIFKYRTQARKRKYAVSSVALIWLVFLLLSLCWFFMSCKTTHQNKEQKTTINNERTDSISRTEMTSAKLLVFPQAAASLNLNFKNLNDLPSGAKFTEKQGQATVSVEKTGKNDFKVTANCDSLTKIIVERETEVFHLQSQLRQMEEATQEEKVEIVNETTPARWFFIYSGRLFWVLTGLGLIYCIWKKKLPF